MAGVMPPTADRKTDQAVALVCRSARHPVHPVAL